MLRVAWSAVLSVSLALAPATAAAFGGFVVGKGDAPVRVRAASVVLVRDGERNAVTVQVTLDGAPEDIALVIPVPQPLRREDVKTLPASALEDLDTMSAPRLFEYRERDPCKEGLGSKLTAQPVKTPWRSITGAGKESTGMYVSDHHYGVASFVAGEYDAVMLGARDSRRIVQWLHANRYRLPAGAEAALRPQVQAGMRFLVARVAPERARRDADGDLVLSPLRVHYERERLELPVGLGLLNAAGPLDLQVFVLGRGRYQAVGSENVAIPTNLQVAAATRGAFSAMYAALVDHVFKARPGAVITEYAWQAPQCTVCTWRGGQAIASVGGEVVFGESEQWGRPRPLGPPPAEVDVAAEQTFQATDPAVHRKYQPRPAPAPSLWMPAGTLKELALTRLRLRPGSAGELLELAPAAAVRGGMPPHIEGEQVGSPAVEPSEVNEFQGRYVIREPWAEPLACQSARRGVWELVPAAPEAPAPGGRSASRTLAEFVVAPASIAAHALAPTSPPVGCGRCDAGDRPGLAALVVLALTRRRRRAGPA